MYRFLASARWIAAILTALLAAAIMVRLGFWQLDRAHQKRAGNAQISASMEADPRSASDVIPPVPEGRPAQADAWTKVTVTGSYDPSQTILIRQRTFEGGVGFEVVVPLYADDGATYLIDRGYVLADAGADQAPAIPDAPSGVVTVIGNTKIPYSTDEAATRVEQVADYRSVRALNPGVLSEELGTPLAGGYISVTDEVPSDGGTVAPIARIPIPALEEGPHLSYAVQWWLFALMTLGGFGYVVRREAVLQLLAEDEDLGDDEPTMVGAPAVSTLKGAP